MLTCFITVETRREMCRHLTSKSAVFCCRKKPFSCYKWHRYVYW